MNSHYQVTFDIIEIRYWKLKDKLVYYSFNSCKVYGSFKMSFSYLFSLNVCLQAILSD